MTTRRRDAADKGQRPLLPATQPALRRRDKSGLRIGQHSPLQYLRLLEELWEVIQSIGPPCWAYGLTAAALKGFDGYELSTPFQLVFPYNRAPHRLDVVVHRMKTFNKLDVDSVHGIPCLSATRTLIEIARTELLRVMAGAELSRGGHSWLERTFLELLGELGLPRPATQQVMAQRQNKIIRVDCRFPDTNVIVELLGYEHHRTTMQMENDAEQLNRLQLNGFAAMQFTYQHVVTRAPVMLETLYELLPQRVA